MAGVASHNMKLFVGHNEFTGQINQMDISDAVAELDDSVAGTDDMEYIPGQVSRTLTASGRWTGDDDEISQAIGSTLSTASLAASSVDGIYYDIGTYNKTSKSVSPSLGSRVNVSIGLRMTGAATIAREVFRQSFPSTTGATTTLTGDVIDLGGVQASAARTIYVYYFPTTGSVPQVQIRVQRSTSRTGTYASADTHSFTANALGGDDPATDTGTYTLLRYMRVQAVISGTGRAGEIVVLATGLPVA